MKGKYREVLYNDECDLYLGKNWMMVHKQENAIDYRSYFLIKKIILKYVNHRIWEKKYYFRFRKILSLSGNVSGHLHKDEKKNLND